MKQEKKKFSFKARHKARELVVQALYQAQFEHMSNDEILADYLLDDFSKKADLTYFRELFLGIVKHLPELDQCIAPLLDRPLPDLTPIERAVLRLATYEFQYCLDVPYRVIINEALELTKTFGTQEGYKYVNGVLDPLARRLRQHE